jgi:hypothetical protein
MLIELDESGRAGAGFIWQACCGAGRTDAARAWRGKDIGECRFKGTAGSQLSIDRRGEGALSGGTSGSRRSCRPSKLWRSAARGGRGISLRARLDSTGIALNSEFRIRISQSYH